MPPMTHVDSNIILFLFKLFVMKCLLSLLHLLKVKTQWKREHLNRISQFCVSLKRVRRECRRANSNIYLNTFGRFACSFVKISTVPFLRLILHINDTEVKKFDWMLSFLNRNHASQWQTQIVNKAVFRSFFFCFLTLFL